MDSVLVAGPMIEKMMVSCGTQMEENAWMEALKNHVVHPQLPPSKPVNVQVRTTVEELNPYTHLYNLKKSVNDDRKVVTSKTITAVKPAFLVQ